MCGEVGIKSPPAGGGLRESSGLDHANLGAGLEAGVDGVRVVDGPLDESEQFIQSAVHALVTHLARASSATEGDEGDLRGSGLDGDQHPPGHVVGHELGAVGMGIAHAMLTAVTDLGPQRFGLIEPDFPLKHSDGAVDLSIGRQALHHVLGDQGGFAMGAGLGEDSLNKDLAVETTIQPILFPALRHVTGEANGLDYDEQAIGLLPILLGVAPVEGVATLFAVRDLGHCLSLRLNKCAVYRPI